MLKHYEKKDSFFILIRRFTIILTIISTNAPQQPGITEIPAVDVMLAHDFYPEEHQVGAWSCIANDK